MRHYLIDAAVAKDNVRVRSRYITARDATLHVLFLVRTTVHSSRGRDDLGA